MPHRIALLTLLSVWPLSAEPLVYEGEEGPGVGKHIVFIANDHEYRSEEVCPMLAKLLAKRSGFRCTVLFGVNEDGFIQPGGAPVPHLEVLKEADLLFFVTRFMNLPDEQADLLMDYFERGGPVVGLRTSTHPFNGQEGKWSKLNFNYEGEDYRGGFGEQIFGNTWHKERGQSHYGMNHRLGGTITALDAAAEHPIMSGVGPIHGYSGAYKSQPPADATPLLEVQVLSTFGPSDDLSPDHPPVNAGWTRESYKAPSGAMKDARVVYASFGASEDLLDEDARRFSLNACYWALGMEAEIDPALDVSVPGTYDPSPFSSRAFYREGVTPQDLAGWDSEIMPSDAPMAGLEDLHEHKGSKAWRALENRPWVVEKIQETVPGFSLSPK